MKEKSLNAAAWEIAKKLPEMNIGEFFTKTTKTVNETRNEVNKQLKREMKRLRTLIEDGDKKINSIKEEADIKIKEINTKHDELMAAIRAAQPELETIEFKLNIDAGTYTPIAVREEKEKIVEPIEEEETTDSIKNEVAELLKRIGAKK